ncbi:MAG: hypothetical protein V4530_09460 [Pseudomonadota bacterium]
MKLLRALVALPGVLLIGASPPSKAWTVFGLELGKPVSIPVCKKKVLPGGLVSEYSYEDNPAEMCHEPESALRDAPWQRGSINFPRAQMPTILHINAGWTLVIDGKIEGLTFDTLDHTYSQLVIAELTLKFGPATSIRRTVGRVISGVAVPCLQAEWRLPGLYVSYRSIDKNIEYGQLNIETPTMEALRHQHDEAAIRQRKSL